MQWIGLRSTYSLGTFIYLLYMSKVLFSVCNHLINVSCLKKSLFRNVLILWRENIFNFDNLNRFCLFWKLFFVGSQGLVQQFIYIIMSTPFYTMYLLNIIYTLVQIFLSKQPYVHAIIYKRK